MSLIARGSLNELHVLLDIAGEAGYLTEPKVRELDDALQRMFSMASGLIRRDRRLKDRKEPGR
jgi:four helix bundle protein